MSTAFTLTLKESKVRKSFARPAQAQKDKKNNYQRKPKHFKGWD